MKSMGNPPKSLIRRLVIPWLSFFDLLFSQKIRSKLLKDKSFKKLTSSAGEGRKPPVPLRAVQPSGAPGRLPTTVSRSQVTPAQCEPRSVQRC